MDVWTQVSGLANETQIDEETLNLPTYQLKARTDYLKAKLQALVDSGALASVRYADVDLALEDSPAVGDVVTVDPDTGRYTKALFGADPVTGDVTWRAMPVGVLTYVRDGKGAVVSTGIVSSFDVSSLLEPGEVFSPGIYRLSHRVAGKITANYAQGAPPVCMLLDLDDAGNPQAAFVSVQHRDPGADHRHNGVRLSTNVSGTLMVADDEYTQPEYRIAGFEPLSAQSLAHGEHQDPAGVPDLVPGANLYDPMYGFTFGNYIGLTVQRVVAGEVVGTAVITNHNSISAVTSPDLEFDEEDAWVILPRTRLRVKGTYSGDDTTYTLGLTDSSGVLSLSINAPISNNDFDNVWLKWVSSDPDEGDGLVRVSGYEVPVSFGKHGCIAILENSLEGATSEAWGTVESAYEYPDRRTWALSVPGDVAGWAQRRVNEVMDGGTGPAMVLFGDQPEGSFRITASADASYTVTFSGQPASGNTIRIGTTTYRFTSGALEAEAGVVDVVIAATAADTYLRLAAAAQGAGFIAGASATKFIVSGVPLLALSPGFANATATHNAAETNLGAAKFLVVDDTGAILTPGPAGLWQPTAYCAPVELVNGLRLQLVKYRTDGTPVGAIVSSNVYIAAIVDEAPGAAYVYNVGMDRALGRVYPPTPLTAAALVRNGVEYNNAAVHPDSPQWRVGLRGLYWYDTSDLHLPFDFGGSQTHVTLYTTTSRAPESGVVTSLQPVPGSPVKVYRCGTQEPATSGDLSIDVELDLETRDTTLRDGFAVKQVDGSKLLRGPVVSQVLAGSGIVVGTRAGAEPGTGQVTIGLSAGGGFEGRFTDVALRNAKQGMVGMFPYIRFPGRPSTSDPVVQSGISARFQVPTGIGPPDARTNFRVFIYVTMFGEQDIAEGQSTLDAAFKLRYAILRAYSGNETDYSGTFTDSLITSVADRICNIPLGYDGVSPYDNDATYRAFDPFTVHNDGNFLIQSGRSLHALGADIPGENALKGGVTLTDIAEIAAQPGSYVGIELDRDTSVFGQTGVYSGHIGITSMRWRLAPE